MNTLCLEGAMMVPNLKALSLWKEERAGKHDDAMKMVETLFQRLGAEILTADLILLRESAKKRSITSRAYSIPE